MSTAACRRFVLEDSKKQNVADRLITSDDLLLCKAMKDLDNILETRPGKHSSEHELQGRCLEFVYRTCSRGMQEPVAMFPIPAKLKSGDWREAWTKPIGASSSKKLRYSRMMQ